MLLVENPQREHRGKQPASHHVQVVQPDADADQFTPLFQPTPPVTEEEIWPVSRCSDGVREEIQRPQDMLVFQPEIVDLLSELVNHGFTQEGSQEEVLHRVERGRLLKAAFVVVPVSENVLCPLGDDVGSGSGDGA